MDNSEGTGSKVLARQLFVIEDRCSARCKGVGQGAGNKVPRAYRGNAEGILGMRRARNTIYSILAHNQARRHWVYSGNYPEHSLLPRAHETQKPSVSQGLTHPATSLIGFDNKRLLQPQSFTGIEPPTSAT